MANEVAYHDFLTIGKETTWGTAVTADLQIPFEAYGVRLTHEAYNPEMFCGTRQGRASEMIAAHNIGGPLNLDAYGYQFDVSGLKSVAQLMIDWALSGPDELDQDSYTAVHYTPNDIRRHAGLRVNTLSITGTNKGPIKLAAQLVGKSETPRLLSEITALDDTQPDFRAMMMQFATFEINSVAVVLNSFNFTINNNLIIQHTNETTPTIVAHGPRLVTWQMELNKTNNDFDTLRRLTTQQTEVPGNIRFTGPHQGTGASGTNSFVNLAFARMALQTTDENRARESLTKDSPTYVIKKPASSANEVVATYGNE